METRSHIVLLLCFISSLFFSNDFFVFASLSLNVVRYPQNYSPDFTITTPIIFDGSRSFSTNNDDIDFTFDMGDGSVFYNSTSIITYVYLNEGTYTAQITANDGVDTVHTFITTVVDSRTECYRFSLYAVQSNGDISPFTPTIVMSYSSSVTIVARIFDPELVLDEDTLTKRFYLLGESPSISFIALSQSSITTTTTISTVFSSTYNGWSAVLQTSWVDSVSNTFTRVMSDTTTIKTIQSQSPPIPLIYDIQVKALGITSAGCSIEVSYFSLSLSPWMAYPSIDSKAQFLPTSTGVLPHSHDVCLPEIGVMLLNGDVILTEDSFSPESRVLDLSAMNFEVFHATLLSQSQVVLLTSQGLYLVSSPVTIVTTTNSTVKHSTTHKETNTTVSSFISNWNSNVTTITYTPTATITTITITTTYPSNITKITTNSPNIDNANFDPSFITLINQPPPCLSSSPSYLFVVYLGVAVFYTNDPLLNTWGNFTAPTHSNNLITSTSFLWDRNVTLYLSSPYINSSSIQISEPGNAQVFIQDSFGNVSTGFSFSSDCKVWNMLSGPASSVLIFGDSIWYGVDGGLTFHQLFVLPLGEIVSYLTISYTRQSYAFITNLNNLYYGVLGVSDIALISSPLVTNPSQNILSTINFDHIGWLYTLEVGYQRKNISVTQTPNSNNINNNNNNNHNNDNNIIYTITLPEIRKTLISVENEVTLSNFALPSCKISLGLTHQALNPINIYAMDDCTETFSSYSIHRTLTINGESGGMIFVQNVLEDGLTLTGYVLNGVNAIQKTSDDDLIILPINGTSKQVFVISNQWDVSDVYRTIIFRLGSIYLQSFVNQTHMQGVIVGNPSPLLFALFPQSYSTLTDLAQIKAVLNYNGKNIADQRFEQFGWSVKSWGWGLYGLNPYSITPTCSFSHIQWDATTLPNGYLSSALQTSTISNTFPILNSNPPSFSTQISSITTSTTTMPSDLTSRASVPIVIYLDIGDSLTLSLLTVPPTPTPQFILSVPNVLNFSILNSVIYDNLRVNNQGQPNEWNVNGYPYSNSTLFFEGMSTLASTTTLTVRPKIDSLTCEISAAPVYVKLMCPISKQVVFVTPFSQADYLDGNPIDKYKLPYLHDIPINYRPPSAFGRAIPTSSNIYHADPSMPRYMDTFTVSKRTGSFKQCTNKMNREECECTDAQKISDDVQYSDCNERVYRVVYDDVFVPQFMLDQDGLRKPFELIYTIEELNGRVDYCFNTESTTTCNKNDLSPNSPLDPNKGDGIIFQGPELYHFRMNVHGNTYCDLSVEFKVWVTNPPPPQEVLWVVVSVTTVFISVVLYIAFLVYSKFYSSNSSVMQ